MSRNKLVVLLAATISLLLSSNIAARVPDANALMNWAEAAYPQYFPSGPTNQTASPYIYRYYPQTNTYLGIAGDIIRVLGPVSGNAILTVGTLSDFACSVYPTDCAPAPLAIFDKPFTGEYPSINLLDHNIPKEFVDDNGTFLTSWGEEHPAALTGMVDGHSGYDFDTPTSTPLLAVAPGTVVRVVTSHTPFFCPPLNRNVTDQQAIYIEHTLADGSKVQSNYVHLSRIDVAVGANVTRGQQIGLSGNTGCSTRPHLHFEVFKVTTAGLVTIDPYGWSGTAPDPWAQQPDGAQSIRLWYPGRAPNLWRQFTYDLSAVQPFAPAFLTKVVYQGIADDINPNNEYLDLTIDSRFGASASLNGYRLQFDRAGFTYNLPAGITLNAAKPTLRIYVGPGTDQSDTVYIGRPAGILSNLHDDCIRVIYPGGGVARFNMGGCP